MVRAKQTTDDNVIRRMCFACWIRKATDTHSENATFINFQGQRWLGERVSVVGLYLQRLKLSGYYFVGTSPLSSPDEKN